jgi:hypothetical protein
VTGQLQISDGRTVLIRDGLTLGRIVGCDVVIDDTKASRRHARFVAEGGVVEIEDLGSSNGTLLNGKPVQKRVLRDGDVIQIGATTLTYREATATAAAPPGDGVDLFGDDAPAPRPTAPNPRPALTPAPAIEPPPQPARGGGLVEFADEVVEVRKALPTGRAGAAAAKSVGGGEPVLAQKPRVLQFSQQAERGALGDDLAQMSNGVRAAIVVGVIAAAAGVGYLAMTLVS